MCWLPLSYDVCRRRCYCCCCTRLAVAGHLTQQNYRLPGMLSFKDNIAFEDVPNGLAAFSKIPPLGTLQIILAIGVHELFVVKQVRRCPPPCPLAYSLVFVLRWMWSRPRSSSIKRHKPPVVLRCMWSRQYPPAIDKPSRPLSP